MTEEYPSNSRVVKRGGSAEPVATAVPKKKVEQVATGGVQRRKKSLLRKAKEQFVGDDSKGVMEYIFVDILVPGAKKTLEDAVTQGVSRKLWGSSAPLGVGPMLRQGWVNYQQPSTLRQQPQMPTGAISQQARKSHRFDEIVFNARVDAESVLNGLHNLVAEFQLASVRDFFDLVGEDAAYTDEQFGWTDLTGAHVRPARGGGYILILPKPIVIN